MSNGDSLVVEGTTLSVYAFVAKAGKPIGPRDVMRGTGLNSPSVAYRHLQKLEDAGLVTKNEYGEYFLKKKTRIHGFKWLGRNLLPTAMLYFIVFLGLAIAELAVLAIHFEVETYEFKVFILIGLSITLVAMTFFLKEARDLTKKIGSPLTQNYR